MVLDHFSIYTIVNEEPAGEEFPVTLFIMIAVIAVISLSAILFKVFGRKQ